MKPSRTLSVLLAAALAVFFNPQGHLLIGNPGRGHIKPGAMAISCDQLFGKGTFPAAAPTGN